MVAYIPFLLAKIADDQDFLRLKEIASVHEDWNLDYDKNGIKIWSKAVEDTFIKMMKVRKNRFVIFYNHFILSFVLSKLQISN